MLNRSKKERLNLPFASLKEPFEHSPDPSYEKANKLMIEYFDGSAQVQLLNGIKEQLRCEYSPYEYHISHEFLCGKIMTSTSTQPVYGSSYIISAFSCENCRTEFNSAVCKECFDLQLHKDHNYELRIAQNGSCDCGDKTKWMEQGFCKAHQYETEKEYLSAEQKSDFQRKTLYFLKMLHLVYHSFLNLIKDIAKITIEEIKIVTERVDSFGEIILDVINSLNKNREAINKLTANFLSEKVKEGVYLKDILLSFTELPKTSIKCVELFTMLFHRNESLREQITIQYIERYSLYTKNYRLLSMNLLSNSLTISDLRQKKTLGKFVLLRKCQGKEDVQATIAAYNEYLLDQSYLSSLTPECFRGYWNYFNSLGGFLQIGNYSSAFTSKEEFQIINCQFYSIQFSFINKMIRILNQIIDLKDDKLLKSLISNLFHKITESKIPIEGNLFFTYERLWALCVYIFLVRRFGSFSNLKNTDSESLLFKVLNVAREPALEKFKLLFSRILQYLSSIYAMQTMQVEDQHANFIKSYYGDINLLYSIDAIFFKIMTKMINYLSKFDKFLKKKVISQEINKYIEDKWNSFITQLKQNPKILQNNEKFGQNVTRQLTYANLLHECVYSDLPDLYLASRFTAFRSLQHYSKRYNSYYHNLLSSIKLIEIDISTFTFLAKYLLWEQKQALSQFINQTKSEQKSKLSQAKSTGKKVDFKSYFISQRVKLLNPNIKSIFDSNDIFSIPYIYLPKDMSIFDTKDNLSKPYVEMMKDCYHLNDSCIYEKLITVFHELILKDYRQMSERQRCFQIIKQIWKLLYFQHRRDLKYQFSKIIPVELISKKQNFEKIQQQGFNFYSTLNYLDKPFIDYMFKLSKLVSSIDIPMEEVPISYAAAVQNLLNVNYIEKEIEDNYKDYAEQEAEVNKISQLSEGKLSNIAEEQELSVQNSDSFVPSEQKSESQQELIPVLAKPVIDNVSESELQKLELNNNQLSSLTNSYQKVQTSIQCSKCKEKENIYQLCNVTFGLVPEFFDLMITEKTLYFTSCGHFYHKACIPQISKGWARCPQCGVKFNFFLGPTNIDLDFSLQHEQIVEMFKTIIRNARLSSKESKNSQNFFQGFYIRILKSFIIFLLTISTRESNEIDEADFRVHETLFNFLKDYINYEKFFNQKEKIMGRLFRVKEQSKYNKLFEYFTQLLCSYLYENWTSRPRAQYGENLPKKQAQLIEKFMKKYIVSGFQIGIKGSSELQTFHKLQLPANISLLLQKYIGACECQANKEKPIFFVCLHSELQSKQNQIKRCIFCYRQFIKQHLLVHESQMMALRTDTGVITYYTLFQKEVWELEAGPIYVNDLMKPISYNQPAILTKFADKSQYKLSQNLFDDIMYNFYRRKYLISNKLTCWKA